VDSVVTLPAAIAFVARPLVFALLVAVAFAPLEHLFAAHEHRKLGIATDAGFATIGAIFTQLGLVVAAGFALSKLELLAFDRSPMARVDPMFGLGVSLLLFELGGYAYHRLAHSVPMLWRLHAVHHSSESMDWLAGFRQHPIEIVLMTIAQNAPLVLLGAPLGVHATVVALLKLNTIFVHANLRLDVGPLRHIVATPAFHHRHHARDGAARNFATLFPFIDRLFGTASDEVAGSFGIDEPMPASFLGLLVHPFRRERDPEPTAAFETRTPAHSIQRTEYAGVRST